MAATKLNDVIQHIRKIVLRDDGGPTDGQLLEDFITRRDEAALAALVRRHGPMVWAVCLRTLRNNHDAEDAFQSTFLVLVRKAVSVSPREMVGNWLYGVAHQTALNARATAIKRRTKEKSVADTPVPVHENEWHDLLPHLDQELSRLPDKYRAVIVLCDLEGKTRQEAAKQLRKPEGTIAGHLARARTMLAKRMARHGREISGGALAAVLAPNGASAGVPPLVVSATIQAVTAIAAGQAAAGVLSAKVIALTEGVVKTMLLKQLKAVTAILLIFGMVAAYGGGRWLTHDSEAAPQVQKPNPEKAAAAPAVEHHDDPKADPLPAQGAVRFGTDRYRHGSQIESMAVSADGKLAVTASGNGFFNPALLGRPSPARVFDLTDGRCLYSLPNERGEYTEAVGLSPDGKVVATKNGKFLTFFCAAGGKELRKRDYRVNGGGGRSITNWMTFTPDGKYVAVNLMGDAVQLVDVETGNTTRTFEIGGAASVCVFSVDGALMATGGYDLVEKDYCVRLWEVGTGKELRRIPAARFPVGNGQKRTLALSADGKTLAGGGWGGGLRLWDTATGKELQAFPKIADNIQSVALTPDGKVVAAAGENIYLYETNTGKERFRIDRNAKWLAFSQDGSVLTGAVSGAIYRWDTASGRQLTPGTALDSAVEQILFTEGGRRMFTIDQDGDLHIWDTAGGKFSRRVASGVERGAVASPDGRLLAWTDKDPHGNSRIRLYDTVAERAFDPVLRSSEGFKVIGGAATVAACLPDGKTLLTFRGNPATIAVWDMESGQEQRSFAVLPPTADKGRNRAAYPFSTTRRTALSPDGKTLAFRSDYPEYPRSADSVPIRLWDVATGKAGHELNAPVTTVNESEEAGFDRTTRLGAGLTWALKSMDGRAFSPDGRLLADWAENPSGPSWLDHVTIWDAVSGRQIANLTAGLRPGAANAAFAPDGRTLATASADGTIRLWEAATWKVRTEFVGHRDRVTAVAFGPDGRLFTGGLDTAVLGWDARPPRAALKGTLAEAWEPLADADAKIGFQAQGRFLAEPAQAVLWFAARVAPAVPLGPPRVNALLADLDNDSFATRDQAVAELRKHWPETAAPLREFAAKTSSLEARRRAEAVIGEMERAITPAGMLRDLRAAEVLEWIATKEARALLLELAKGPADVSLTRDAAAAYKRLGGGR